MVKAEEIQQVSRYRRGRSYSRDLPRFNIAEFVGRGCGRFAQMFSFARKSRPSTAHPVTQPDILRRAKPDTTKASQPSAERSAARTGENKFEAPGPLWHALALRTGRGGNRHANFGGVADSVTHHANPGGIQAKLMVGASSDPLEQEADRVADQVMNMSSPRVAPTPGQSTAGSLQRMCTECEEEESQARLQRRVTAGETTMAGEAPPIVQKTLQSTGQPLDRATRAFFEPRFGRDLSSVRVHTDPRADESTRAVSALAYTVGRDIVFGPGNYAPHNREGRKLLAHELAHVVQQRAAHSDSVPLLQRQPNQGGSSGTLKAGCDITVPTDPEIQLIAGVIFAEANAKRESNDEREAIGSVFDNRVSHTQELCDGMICEQLSEKARKTQCKIDDKDFGHTVQEAIQKGSVAYGKGRWNMVMDGDSMKPEGDLCALSSGEITALIRAIEAAETVMTGDGPRDQGFIAFNKAAASPPNPTRMEVAQSIGAHTFYRFKSGKECG